jgi:hypothetical protein
MGGAGGGAGRRGEAGGTCVGWWGRRGKVSGWREGELDWNAREVKQEEEAC